MVNKLRPRLPEAEWQITIIDTDDRHHYQPGYLLLPFGTYPADQLIKPRTRFITDGVDIRFGTVASIDPDAAVVTLEDGQSLSYDQLVIATGAAVRPDQTPRPVGTRVATIDL